jgi:putative nucleotidyltransferase with HDIG domain
MNLAEGNRRAAIVLGAGTFKKAPSLTRSGLSSSAEDFVSYLLDEKLFALPKANLLNLFGCELSPGEQLERMCDFLETFCRLGGDGDDIILYYVGHGGFTGVNQEYFLAIASTKEHLEGPTSIRGGELSSVLRNHARRARKYLILDCCFAASLHSQFQSPTLSSLIASQTLEPLPPRGTALLCSSGSRQLSWAPDERSHTVFSGALMEVLRKGETSGLEGFSLDDLCRRITLLLKNGKPGEWTRPEVHSPDMREGSLAHVPLFPNPAFDPRLRPFFAGSPEHLRSLELMVAMRDGQLRQLTASLDRHLEIVVEVVGDSAHLQGIELSELGRKARSRWMNELPDLSSGSSALLPDHLHSWESSVEPNRVKSAEETISSLRQSYDITLQALGDALDLRDREAEGHSKRVTAFTMAIARSMGIPREEIDVIARGAFLHDIGKMAMPDSILFKKGKLNTEEMEIMREHCYHGYQMLKRIPFLSGVSEIVYSHQEHFDGSGYPRGLKGQEIPLGSRIFSVADTLEAITSDRPYRAAITFSAARKEIRAWSGRQFDPSVVEVFLKMPADIFEDLRREINAQSYPFAIKPEAKEPEQESR